MNIECKIARHIGELRKQNKIKSVNKLMKILSKRLDKKWKILQLNN